MKTLFLPLALCAAALPSIAAAQMSDADIAAMRDDARHNDTLAHEITEGLTTEIGQRMAGTEAEARARAWAAQRLNGLGFANVAVEPYRMPTWVRGAETAAIVSPYRQAMHVTALGRSAATPASGLTAEIVGFASVEALRAAPMGSLAGKIAYVTHHMERTQDGSGYGFAGPTRWNAPSLAAQRGATAIVIRSVGTDSHRNPHTGGTTWEEGVEPIAAGNVIAEVPGSDPAAGIIIIACHLDSWDLATGAIDDASGCGIITAAAHRILESGEQPRRTIRLLWAGAEEVGIYGARAYFEAHGDEFHALASESDFGADRVWKVDFNLPEGASADADRLSRVLAPLGISRGTDTATSGADTSPLVGSGVWAIDLKQDGTRYFDLHHTPDDTLDKIDPAQLRQNVAAWTAMLAVFANSAANFAPNSPNP